MSIEYIKQNLNKFDKDNLLTFIFDIITCGSLDEVEDFDASKSYVKGEKVYCKDMDGVHHIYKCKVEQSTPGNIIYNEWIDLLQSFRRTIISEESILTTIDAKEEVIISTQMNQVEFILETPGIEDNDYYLVVFHPDLGRLSVQDYQVVGRRIVLKPEFAVANMGDRLIVDIYANQ